MPQGDRPFSFVVYSSEIRDFGLHDSKQHAINVTSDWSSNTNTSKDSDWAIGLLAFDDGTIDIQGDMNINLDVKNMKVNDKSLTGAWEDHAAGIYVAKGSHFTTGEDVTLNITVSGDGSGLQRKTLVPIHPKISDRLAV